MHPARFCETRLNKSGFITKQIRTIRTRCDPIQSPASFFLLFLRENAHTSEPGYMRTPEMARSVADIEARCIKWRNMTMPFPNWLARIAHKINRSKRDVSSSRKSRKAKRRIGVEQLEDRTV